MTLDCLEVRFGLVGMFVAVVAVYSYLPVYLAMFAASPVQPVIVIAALIAGAALLLLPGRLPLRWRDPLVQWVMLYFVVMLAAFALAGGVWLQALFSRSLSLVLLLVVFLVVAADPRLLRTARAAVVACVCVGAVLNVVDFLRPGLFIPLPDPLAHPGRGAGLYMNPNSAGVALVIGMVLGAGILTPRMRLVLVLVAGVGVAATLSRSSILAFIIAAVGLTISGTVSWRQLFLVLVAAFGGAIAASQALVGLVPEIAEVDWRDFLERVQWFTQPGGVVDASASDRQRVAAAALDLYMQHPWTGLGFGYTSHWQVGIAPHNQYLFFMVEYGLAGVLLFPGLLMACVWRSRGADGRDAMLAVVLFALLGMFSHDLVNDYYAVCGLALAAAMSRYPDIPAGEDGFERGGGRVLVEAFDGPPASFDPAGR